MAIRGLRTRSRAASHPVLLHVKPNTNLPETSECCPQARQQTALETFHKDIVGRAAWRVGQRQFRPNGGASNETELGFSPELQLLDQLSFAQQEDKIDESGLEATVTRIASAFPNAKTNKELVKIVSQDLEKHGFSNGFGTSNTLLCTSLCCDELSRPLEDDFRAVYGPRYFSMGGLAGFAFGGVTSFGAMGAHIPDGGNCLIVYGPHVGVDSTGAVGTVERFGRERGGNCCGSARAAAKYVTSVLKFGAKEMSLPDDPLDSEQYFVGKQLLAHGKQLIEAEDPMVELPFIMFQAQDEMLTRILEQACGRVAGDGKIALVGGIQINTPDGLSDFFLPLRFQVRSNKNDLVANLLK